MRNNFSENSQTNYTVELSDIDNKELARYRLIFNVLTAIYITYCIKYIVNQGDSAFNYIFYFLLLVFSGLCLSLAEFLHYRKIYLDLFILFFVFLLFRGLFHGNYWMYFFADFAKFSTFSVILLLRESKFLNYFLKKIPNLFAGWLFLGLPLALFFTLQYGVTFTTEVERGSFKGAAGMSDIFNPTYFIDHSMFILPFYSYLTGFRKTITIMSIITLIIFGAITATRTAVIGSILSIIFTIFFLQRFSLKQKIYFYFTTIIVLSISAIIIFQSNQFTKSSEYLVSRLKYSENYSTGRNIEAESYFSSIQTDELIMGKGIGGAQTVWIWKDVKYGVSMLHLGYAYLILKGGLVFMIFIYIVSLIALWRLFSRKGIYQIYATVIFLFLFLEFSHTQWLFPINLILYMMALSLGLNITSYRKHNISNDRRQ